MQLVANPTQTFQLDSVQCILYSLIRKVYQTLTEGPWILTGILVSSLIKLTAKISLKNLLLRGSISLLNLLDQSFSKDHILFILHDLNS